MLPVMRYLGSRAVKYNIDFESLPVIPWVVVTSHGYGLRGEELAAKSGAVNLQGIVQFIRHLPIYRNSENITFKTGPVKKL